MADFGLLTARGHLGFWEKWKILSQACSKGQVVCPCQILSGSDEPDPSYCKKCEFSSSSSASTATASTATASTTALCEKAVHRASHFPVGANNDKNTNKNKTNKQTKTEKNYFHFVFYSKTIHCHAGIMPKGGSHRFVQDICWSPDERPFL